MYVWNGYVDTKVEQWLGVKRVFWKEIPRRIRHVSYVRCRYGKMENAEIEARSFCLNVFV